MCLVTVSLVLESDMILIKMVGLLLFFMLSKISVGCVSGVLYIGS